MLMPEYESRASHYLGMSTIVWYIIGFIFVAYTLLVNFTSEQVQFNSTLIFAFLFFGGIILLHIIPARHGERVQGEDELGPFWMENPSGWKSLILVVGGFFGILGISYVAASAQQPFWGIFFSGFVMLFVLFETRAILAVILIHGAFNSLVLAIQAGLVGNSLTPLATSGVGMIPIIGNYIPNIAPIFSEIGFQFFLVATAEEVLKIVAIAGFIIMLKGYYTEDTHFKWIGGGAAVTLWAFLHYIVSIH